MAISRDDVHFCISRSMQFLTTSAWNFAKNHPFVSLILLFFSFLYACFPWFFWALIHLLAFLILVGSITRIYYSSPPTKKSPVNDKNSNADSLKPVNISKNDTIKDRNGRPFVRAQSVRQRRSRDTSRTNSVQDSEDEKNTVIVSSTFNNDMVDKNPLLEENPKEIREVKVDNFISKVECSPSSNDPDSLKPESDGKSHQESQKSVGGGDIDSESSEEDEHEREENIKAVQWTEDDEKNLMDLGFSEIERNKRLESLIARRRARKLLSLQIRRTQSKDISLIPHIAIPKNKPFIEIHTSGQVSPTPGSAPPVLLPVHDPFDLPYDPHEEKPDLTGGSFHQEFIPPEPQDHVFCRHASFCFGNPHPGDFKQDQQETWTHKLTNQHMASEGLQNSNAENQLEEKDTDKIIEVESCHSPGSNLKNIKADHCNTEEIQSSPGSNLKNNKADHCNTEEIQSSEKGTVLVDITEENQNTEVETKAVVVDSPSYNQNTEVETKAVVVDNPSYRSSSNSSEEDAPFIRVDKEAILKSLTSPHPRSMSLNRDTSNQMRYILNNYCSPMMNNGMHHKPTHSIASDMQVEVSEISSPPQTIDGSVSSFEIGSPIEEEDIASDITYRRNESNWELSSQPSINDEDKSVLKEMYKLHDENAIKLGSSRSRESKDSVALHELAKSMEEQDVIDSFSRTDSKDELLNDGSQENIADIHMEVKDKFQTSTPEPSQPLISGTSAFPDAENVKKLTEKQMVQHFQSDGAEILEEPTHPSTCSMEANSSPSSTESNAGHERRQKETMEVPEITSTRISDADTITVLQKPKVENNPSISDEINNKSEDPHKHADPPALANLSEQVDQAKRLLADTEESSNPSTSSTEANLFPSRTEFEVTKHEEQQNETMELPESTSTKIRGPETIAAPMEEINPSTLVKINDKSDEPQEQEASHPSTSSTEAKSSPIRTDSEIADHERRQNEPMEVTQSPSTRITSLDTIASPPKPFEESNSSFLDKNNNSEDPHTYEAPPALAIPNEQVNELSRLPIDTKESAHPSTSGMTTISPPFQTESSVAEDERQNETIEVPENASSSSTSPITKETLHESIAESSPSTLDDKDDKPEGPHIHGAQSAFTNPDKQVNQEYAPLVKTEVSQLEADASAASSHEKETSRLVESEAYTSDNGKFPRNSDSEDTGADESEKSDAQIDSSGLSV